MLVMLYEKKRQHRIRKTSRSYSRACMNDKSKEMKLFSLGSKLETGQLNFLVLPFGLIPWVLSVPLNFTSQTMSSWNHRQHFHKA